MGLGVAGTLVVTIALLAASGEDYGRYGEARRALMFDGAAQSTQVILYSLGLFALAKRYVGAPRLLAQVAAWLMFAGLAWLVMNMVWNLFRPAGAREAYKAVGLIQSLVLLAASILLTIAADAWRRVPVAAAGLIVLQLTSYSFPVIGELIGKAIDGDVLIQRLYITTREVLTGLSLLFVAGALAAGGRAQPENPAVAARGFRLAYGVLIARVLAAIYMVLVGFAAVRSPETAKLLALTGPLVLIGTQLVLAIAIAWISVTRVDGMPRFRIGIAAAGLFWYAMLQLEGLPELVRGLWGGYDGRYGGELRPTDMFSVVGPIVSILSLALVGSAIISFASQRANAQLGTAATSRTVGFVVVSLSAVALPSFVSAIRTPSSSLMLALMIGVGGVVALLLLTGLMRKASEAVEALPGIPAARVVQVNTRD
ncbi:MAG: hypothetical protein WKG01_24165 [Kofleriaceae bacterium]